MINTRLLYAVFFLIFLCGFQVFCQEHENGFDAQGKRHGLWKKYYSNGHLKYEGRFEHGKEVGVFKHYDASGPKNPVIIKTFLKADSVQVEFYSVEGLLESKGLFIKGIKDGDWT